MPDSPADDFSEFEFIEFTYRQPWRYCHEVATLDLDTLHLIYHKPKPITVAVEVQAMLPRAGWFTLLDTTLVLQQP